MTNHNHDKNEEQVRHLELMDNLFLITHEYMSLDQELKNLEKVKKDGFEFKKIDKKNSNVFFEKIEHILESHIRLLNQYTTLLK